MLQKPHGRRGGGKHKDSRSSRHGSVSIRSKVSKVSVSEQALNFKYRKTDVRLEEAMQAKSHRSRSRSCASRNHNPQISSSQSHQSSSNMTVVSKPGSIRVQRWNMEHADTKDADELPKNKDEDDKQNNLSAANANLGSDNFYTKSSQSLQKHVN